MFAVPEKEECKEKKPCLHLHRWEKHNLSKLRWCRFMRERELSLHMRWWRWWWNKMFFYWPPEEEICLWQTVQLPARTIVKEGDRKQIQAVFQPPHTHIRENWAMKPSKYTIVISMPIFRSLQNHTAYSMTALGYVLQHFWCDHIHKQSHLHETWNRKRRFKMKYVLFSLGTKEGLWLLGCWLLQLIGQCILGQHTEWPNYPWCFFISVWMHVNGLKSQLSWLMTYTWMCGMNVTCPVKTFCSIWNIQGISKCY